ncbi:MAG: lysylphosphatidylglycerol synthase transmembrane domain-containing protein [Gemmatimonadales bacterium]
MLVLVVIAIWAVRNLDAHALVAAIHQSNWRLLLLAMGANVTVLALQAWRWKVLLTALAPVSYLEVVSALIVGVTTSSLVPARAGEVVRVHLIARKMNVRRASVAGTALLDHIVNGVSIVPLLAALPFLGEIPTWMQRSLFVVLVVVCGGAVLAWFTADASEEPRVHQNAWMQFLARVRHGLRGVRSLKRMGQAASISVVAWIGEVAVILLSIHAFDPHYGVGVAILALVSINIAIAVPSPPGNFGTLELGVVLVVVAFGMQREQAIALALAYHVVQLVSVWLLCLPAMWWLRRSEVPAFDGSMRRELP